MVRETYRTGIFRGRVIGAFPLPIWRTEDGLEERCIGSVADLKEAITKANEVLGLQQELPKDLHRPYIDDVVLVSSRRSENDTRNGFD